MPLSPTIFSFVDILVLISAFLNDILSYAKFRLAVLPLFQGAYGAKEIQQGCYWVTFRNWPNCHPFSGCFLAHLFNIISVDLGVDVEWSNLHCYYTLLFLQGNSKVGQDVAQQSFILAVLFQSYLCRHYPVSEHPVHGSSRGNPPPAPIRGVNIFCNENS